MGRVYAESDLVDDETTVPVWFLKGTTPDSRRQCPGGGKLTRSLNLDSGQEVLWLHWEGPVSLTTVKCAGEWARID